LDQPVSARFSLPEQSGQFRFAWVFDINLDCHAALALPRRGFLSQHPLPDSDPRFAIAPSFQVDSVRSKEQSRNKKNGRV